MADTIEAPGGVAALTLGILAVTLCWTGVFGLVLGILAIVFAAKGRKAAGRQPDRLRATGAHTAGLVLGIVGTSLAPVAAALVVLAHG